MASSQIPVGRHGPKEAQALSPPPETSAATSVIGGDAGAGMAAPDPAARALRRRVKSRAPLRLRQAGRRSPLHYVTGALVLAAAIGFFVWLLPHITPRDHESRPWHIDTQWDTRGTITLAPRGEFCRQMVLDNTTGELLDRGLVRCGPGGTAPAQQQGAGDDDRLGAVRRSFNNR